ncbi:MAG: hypothetical protein AAGG02_00400, partial [Cyanobacteria bacterium P01_H01_bin.15]
ARGLWKSLKTIFEKQFFQRHLPGANFIQDRSGLDWKGHRPLAEKHFVYQNAVTCLVFHALQEVCGNH